MTIDTAPVELLDLALELYYAGDADTLTNALALAEDMDAALGDLALDWDEAVEALAQLEPPEDDVIADYRDTKRRAQQWLEGYRHGYGLDLE